MVRKLGNRKNNRFWLDRGVWEVHSNERFGRLFTFLTQKECFMRMIGVCKGVCGGGNSNGEEGSSNGRKRSNCS